MENFITYHKIKRLGDEENKDIFINPETDVCIQEKVDGANFRVYIKDGKVIFGSRTQQLTSDNGEDTNIEKNFRRGVEYVREKLSKVPLEKLDGLILFMECMTKHTISYNWDTCPPVIGFDVYSEKENNYYHWTIAETIFKLIDIEFIPIIKICKAKDLTEINDDFVPQSKYYSGKAEGVVFKTFNPRIYAKYVRTEFKEKNLEEFGGKRLKNTTEDSSGEIVGKFCTNYRVEKMILKLLDEGKKLDMPLMKELPNRVYEDMWEECWREIIYLKQRSFSLDTLRKEVTKRCLVVLKSMITNNALNNPQEEIIPKGL